MDADGERLGLKEEERDELRLGLKDSDSEGDNDLDKLGETDALGERLSDRDGDCDNEGLNDGDAEKSPVYKFDTSVGVKTLLKTAKSSNIPFQQGPVSAIYLPISKSDVVAPVPAVIGVMVFTCAPSK